MSTDLKDAWYVIAPADAIAAGPIQRWIFGEPVVLFRGAEAAPIALFDMCSHRNAPLSLGKVVDGTIQCRYHGFQFNSSGRCIAIPNQSSAPAKTLAVRAYPVRERYGLLWIWPGAPANATEVLPIEWPQFTDPQYRSLYVDLTVNAPLEMLVDNLMDLTHVHFVHKFGVNLPVHNSEPMRVWSTERRVHFTRNLVGGKFLSDKGESTQSDSFMEIGGTYHPPGIVTTFALPKSRETAEAIPGPQRLVIHGLTPETHERTRYVYMRSWNLYHSPEEIAAAIAEDTEALQEDKDILEKTYAHRRQLGSIAQERLVTIDEAAVRARRLLDSMRNPAHE